MEHWRFLENHRRDAVIIKGIQGRVISLFDATQKSIPETPERVVPKQADDNILSALDDEIAVLQQVTGAVLAGGNGSIGGGSDGR